jgi:hypothetical protein
MMNKVNNVKKLKLHGSDRLVTMKEITWKEAAALVSGKTEKPGGIDPVQMLKDLNYRYYLANIPVLSLGDPEGEFSLEEWASFGSKKRVEEYAKRKTKAPPIIVRMYHDTTDFLSLVDGGHRVGAAFKKGRKFINAIIITPFQSNRK